MKKNKKNLFFCVLGTVLTFALGGQTVEPQTERASISTNQDTIVHSSLVKKEFSDLNVQAFMNELTARLKTVKTIKEKKDIYAVLGSLQEQMGLYPEAQASYNAAAALWGMNETEGQELMLGAVRCALSCGDTSSADFLLSTQFDQLLSTEIGAEKKLYALWSWLAKSENHSDIESVIPVLQTYATAQEMLSVQPVVLLTLYEITDDTRWGDMLVAEHPHSAEAAIVFDNAALLPAPFWYFSLAKTE